MTSALQTNLAQPKVRMGMTVAQWNHINTKSIELKRVQLRPDEVSPTGKRIGYEGRVLRPTQTRVEARFKAMINGQEYTIYMRTEIDLAKKLPQFSGRVERPKHHSGVRTKAFSVADELPVPLLVQ